MQLVSPASGASKVRIPDSDSTHPQESEYHTQTFPRRLRLWASRRPVYVGRPKTVSKKIRTPLDVEYAEKKAGVEVETGVQAEAGPELGGRLGTRK